MAEMLSDWYLPNAMAGYMDFGWGPLWVTVLWVLWFGLRPSFWVLCAGGALALLPDILDQVPSILRGHIDRDHHQLPTHFPLVMIPTAVFVCAVGGALAAGWEGAKRWALLAFVCLLWHFLHDSPELGGGGIAWKGPWDTNYYTLLGEKIPVVISTHEVYLEHAWRRASTLAQRELALGTAALMFSALLLRSWHYAALGVFITLGVYGVAITLWYPGWLLPLGVATASP